MKEAAFYLHGMYFSYEEYCKLLLHEFLIYQKMQKDYNKEFNICMDNTNEL